jgi:KaiC/GvpD/RAD55 family RecA-like ATPase
MKGRYANMSDEKNAYRLSEIERKINEFKEKFEARTKDSDDFITISEIEALWSDLQHKTNNIYSDMLMDMMSNVDETALIHKKKENTAKKK